MKSLKELGLQTEDSDANFVFVRFESSETASRIFHSLMEQGILVRYFDHDGLRNGLRITVGTNREMDHLTTKLRSILS